MITAIITDFDGTLVDTFKANFYAYQEAFDKVGLILTEEQYRECFGFRFEKFMQAVGVTDSDLIQRIKDEKLNAYPKYFEHLRPNTALIQLLQSMRENGCQIAIASTARMENLMNVLTYLNLQSAFDLIYAGKDVKQGKPSPEIYLKTMEALSVNPSETLIFEDSAVGIEAAKTSGAHYMVVSSRQFEI